LAAACRDVQNGLQNGLMHCNHRSSLFGKRQECRLAQWHAFPARPYVAPTASVTSWIRKDRGPANGTVRKGGGYIACRIPGSQLRS
jgi:hypothetical protein